MLKDKTEKKKHELKKEKTINQTQVNLLNLSSSLKFTTSEIL
jgi:hypothetical protein